MNIRGKVWLHIAIRMLFVLSKKKKLFVIFFFVIRLFVFIIREARIRRKN
jgi:hypothetical protein